MRMEGREEMQGAVGLRCTWDIPPPAGTQAKWVRLNVGGHRLPHHQADPVSGAEVFPLSLVPGRGAAVGPGKAAGLPPAPWPTEHGEGWRDAGMEPDPGSCRSS